jgi:alanine dehydrogenase
MSLWYSDFLAPASLEVCCVSFHHAPREAARQADIVVLATCSRTPLLDTDDVRPGAHITSLGADEPGKAELSPALLRAGQVFVDDVPLALATGALGTAALSAADTAGTLSQVLQGTIPGRQTEADLTIYTPVGLPWQDPTHTRLDRLPPRTQHRPRPRA